MTSLETSMEKFTYFPVVLFMFLYSQLVLMFVITYSPYQKVSQVKVVSLTEICILCKM
jgi:hypothetical protein